MKWLRDGDKIKREGEEGWRSWKLEVNEDLKKGKLGATAMRLAKRGIRESPTKSIFIHGFAPEGHATFSELLQCQMNGKRILKERESQSFQLFLTLSSLNSTLLLRKRSEPSPTALVLCPALDTSLSAPPTRLYSLPPPHPWSSNTLDYAVKPCPPSTLHPLILSSIHVLFLFFSQGM